MKQVDLARAAGVTDVTVKNYERGATPNPHDATLIAIRKALEKAGVIFQDENDEGPGVRLRKGRR
jgi:transcriptional regulator with XRE-family HTH domain